MARAASVTVALCRHFLRCVRVHRHWLLPLLLAAPVTHTHDGDGASSANNGLRNGACGLNGSVGAPLASFGNSDGRSGSIGAPPATREYLAPSPTTSASAPASSAPVPRECSVASSAINGIRMMLMVTVVRSAHLSFWPAMAETTADRLERLSPRAETPHRRRLPRHRLSPRRLQERVTAVVPPA